MAEAEQFSLRWNNFHSNLSEGFHSLLEEVDLVDVTLAAEGQYLQAHKIVLSVCSPYFKQLFKANPCKHPIVILKDVCHKDLVALLQFMYQGEVNVCQEELAPFLKTAEMLQIKGLTGSESKSSVPLESPSLPSVQSPPSTPRILRESQESQSSGESTSRPFKRLCTESSHVAAAAAAAALPTSSTSGSVVATSSSSGSGNTPATSQSVKPSDTSRVEFLPISNPKPEPVDYESDSESRKESSASLAQLLHGSESSQPPPDLQPAPPVLFNPVASLPQDSGGSQDSMQGMLGVNYQIGTMQLGRHVLVPTEIRNKSHQRVQKRCVICYATYRMSMNSSEAAKKAKRISTFCPACPSHPFLCINCFRKAHHSSET